MVKLNHTSKLFNPKNAEIQAKALRSEDEDWTYIVKHDPTGKGYSFIEIYDEDGEFVEKF